MSNDARYTPELAEKVWALKDSGLPIRHICKIANCSAAQARKAIRDRERLAAREFRSQLKEQACSLKLSGATHREIASALGTSPRWVKRYTASVKPIKDEPIESTEVFAWL